MNRLLVTALTLILIADFSAAVQALKNPLQLPAPTPALQQIRGVTSENSISWTPIVFGKTSAVWKAFSAERSGFISTSFGTPLAFVDTPIDNSQLEQQAVDFIKANANQLGCADCDITLEKIVNVKDLTIVRVNLRIDDTPIEGSSVILVINKNGDLISIKSNGYGNEIGSRFIIDSKTAINSITPTLAYPVEILNVEPVWLPRSSGQTAIRLNACYKLETSTTNPALQPTFFVDAEFGGLLAAENRVTFIEVEGATSGGVFPLYGTDDPETRQFPYHRIVVENEEVHSDGEGLFRMELNEDDAPFRASATLQGMWAEVHEFDNNDASFDEEFELDALIDVFWSDENSSVDERNLYYHVTLIHEYFKQLEPEFDGLDYPMQAVCGMGGPGYEAYEDNAFSSGQGLFFGRGNRADNFAHYADVIYHEYGHSVTSVIYRNHALPYEGESGAMNEGWSDYFTCSLTDESYIGEGGLLGQGYIRNIDNELVYPRNMNGEVHDDSRMFSAAMWHTREVMGAEYCDSLFHFARYLVADDFREYFLDVLLTDDDDGDLTNGSPNYREIYRQFARHGIGLNDSTDHFMISGLELDDLGNQEGEGIDNGFYEPGETISLNASIFRSGAPVPFNDDSVYVQLMTDSPYIQIINDLVKLPPLEPGETGNTEEPLTFRIHAQAPLIFANYIIIVGASQGETPLIDTVRIPLGRPSTLVVRDGTREIDRTPWIHKGLDDLGVVYTDHNSVRPDYPLSQIMHSFKNIIWFTGDEREDILTEDSRQELTSFLDNGGNLLLTGQYLPDWTGAEDFLATRMGARFVTDTLALTYLEGEDGDSISDGHRLLLIGGDGARNQGRPAIIEAVNGSVVTYRWARIEGRPAGAVRKFDPETGAKTMFFAFGIEAIGAAGRTTTLAEVLEKSLAWLEKEEAVNENPVLAAEFRLEPAYPNPFNGTTTLKYSLPINQKITLEIFDIAGRSISTLFEGVQSAGYHQEVWNSAEKPSGVYFAQLKSANRVERKMLLLLR